MCVKSFFMKDITGGGRFKIQVLRVDEAVEHGGDFLCIRPRERWQRKQRKPSQENLPLPRTEKLYLVLHVLCRLSGDQSQQAAHLFAYSATLLRRKDNACMRFPL